MSKRKNQENKSKKFNTYSFVLATIGLLLAVNEMNEFYNYKDSKSFLLLFGLIGLILAIAILLMLNKKSYLSLKKEKKNAPIIFLTIIGFIGLAISLGGKLNRQLAEKKSNCKEVLLIEKKIVKGRRIDRFVIRTKVEKETKEITISKENWGELNPNEQVQICDYKGFWGYEYSKLKE